MALASAGSLSDGLVFLRPLTDDDAEDHLAGEDDEQIRWLNFGKPSTAATVAAFIQWLQDARQTGLPMWNFGVWLVSTQALVGNVEGSSLPGLKGIGPGEANISYVVFPPWRGQGFAPRAVSLLCGFLSTQGVERAVIRADPRNHRSISVALRGGFHSDGTVKTPDATLLRFVRDL